MPYVQINNSDINTIRSMFLKVNEITSEYHDLSHDAKVYLAMLENDTGKLLNQLFSNLSNTLDVISKLENNE